MSPIWQGRMGRQASGPVPPSNHITMAPSSMGACTGPRVSPPEAQGAPALPWGSQSPPGASPVLASTSRLPEEGSPPMPSPWAQVQPDSGQSPACLGHGYINHLWVSHSVREGLAGQKPLCPGSGQGWGQGAEGVKSQRGCCRACSVTHSSPGCSGLSSQLLDIGCGSPNGPQSQTGLN